jgi:hypothetical protein
MSFCSPMNMPYILHIHIFTYVYVPSRFANDVKVPPAPPAVLASDNTRIASRPVTHSKAETDSKYHPRCDETGLSHAYCCPRITCWKDGSPFTFSERELGH